MLETLQLQNATHVELFYLYKIPKEVREAPSTIMFIATSKWFIFIIVNIFTFMTVAASGWEITRHNKFHHGVSSRVLNDISIERNSRENPHIVNTINSHESAK